MNTNGWIAIVAASVAAAVGGIWYFDRLTTKREVARRMNAFDEELDAIARNVGNRRFD